MPGLVSISAKIRRLIVTIPVMPGLVPGIHAVTGNRGFRIHTHVSAPNVAVDSNP
jgi:hypothetical protein